MMTAMRMLYIIMCTAAFPCAGAMAADAGTGSANACHADTIKAAAPAGVLERIDAHTDRMRSIGSGVWDNPAMRPFEQSYSYTTVGLEYRRERQDKAVSTQAGDGYDGAGFAASAYIRHGNATLWGEGGYTTGRHRSPVWNEVANAELLYPYLTADDTGGDISSETYRFAGGYAARNGRLAWGASLGYTAGQHYRDVDPRPRNVTGRLEAAAGIGWRPADRYVFAVGGEAMKYKQTSDIDFKSELGRATIYHLTGLGTDYVRFRGNGMTTHYDGTRYAVRLDMTPERGNGMLATLRMARLTVKTILNDMNKLPMASLWHNTLDAAVGYRHNGHCTAWGVAADMNIYRRHGSENIFGDAASAIYPQIGTVEMFADNGYTVAARGVAEHDFGGVRLAYEPAAGYSHVCRIYLDPPREWLVNSLSVSQRLTAAAMLGRRWHAALEVAWTMNSPTESHFVTEEFFGIEPQGGNERLMEALRSDFTFASSVSRSYSAAVSVSRALNDGYALRLSAGFRHDGYAASTHGNAVSIGAAVIF